MILNKLKTVALLAIMSSLLLLMGDLLGGIQGLTIALVLSIILNGSMYFFSDKIVLGMYQAQKLPETEYNWIYEIVSDLSHEMRLPMPKLWLVKDPMANAFATGRNPSNSSIAVTSGILSILTPDDTASASMASLFIVHPFTSGGLMELFSTHPTMKKRVEKLYTIHQQKGY